jgi:hypothetical protein
MSGEPKHTNTDRFQSTLGVVREARAEGDAKRQEDDERLAGVWGIGACDVCGRTIVLGEKAARFRSSERVVDVCPVCESGLIAQGHRRAA